MNTKVEMKVRTIICPCCKKNINIPIQEYHTEFDFNYSTLLNSTKEFFDLVEICPECGYTMLFDNGISDKVKNFIASDEYRKLWFDQSLENGLKKWIMIAMLSEYDENYTEAGIEYTKAYDYLELKNMPLDKHLIEKAAVCFLNASDEYGTFLDAFLAVDSMRRDGEIDRAKQLLKVILETFEGNLVDKLTWKEQMWLDINETEKRYLDI